MGPRMTKRAFYRCPIKAAYMAKYHGIHFDDCDSFRSACEAVGDDAADMSVEGAFYLHPDSMGLLEPQVGDRLLVTREDGSQDVFNIQDEGWGLTIQLGWPPIHLSCPHRFPKLTRTIIQRNGQSFIWPEWEQEK